MKPRCDGNHPHKEKSEAGKPYTDNQCLLCFYAVNPQQGQIIGTQTIGPRIDCKSLGIDTGETIVCEGCPSKPRMKIYSCGKHGKCCVGYNQGSVRGCATCVDYSKKE